MAYATNWVYKFAGETCISYWWGSSSTTSSSSSSSSSHCFGTLSSILQFQLAFSSAQSNHKNVVDREGERASEREREKANKFLSEAHKAQEKLNLGLALGCGVCVCVVRLQFQFLHLCCFHYGNAQQKFSYASFARISSSWSQTMANIEKHFGLHTFEQQQGHCVPSSLCVAFRLNFCPVKVGAM